MSVESGSKGNEALSNKGFFDLIREGWNSLRDFVSEKFATIKETFRNLNFLKRDIVSSGGGSISSDISPESREINRKSLKDTLKQICVRSRSYESVYDDDNGSVSIGKLQFHAEKAETVLNNIKRANPSRFNSIMTDSLFRNIHNASFSVWNGNQIAQYKKLMKDSSAQREMDKCVDDTIQGYLDRIQRWGGVTNPKAILAFGRICNYGPAFAEKIKNKMVKNGQDINDYNQVIDCYEANTTGRVHCKFQKPDPALGKKNIREFIGEYRA